MAKQKNHGVFISDKEKWWGFGYLLFQLCVLPSLLLRLNGLLKYPLDNAWLNFLYFSLNFFFVCTIFKTFLKRSLSHAGSYFGDFLIAVVPGFAVYWVANFLLSMLIQKIVPDYVNLNAASIIGMTSGNFVVMVLGTVLFVPVVEETLHRGLVFGTLYKKNPTLAYVFSAALFAVIHVAGYVGIYSTPALLAAVVQYLPAGFILAWAYRKSGSIYAPILIHMAVNTVGICIAR